MADSPDAAPSSAVGPSTPLGRRPRAFDFEFDSPGASKLNFICKHRKRKEPAAEDFVYQHQFTPRAKKQRDDLSASFANLDLGGARRFAASYSGGRFGVTGGQEYKRTYRRAATVDASVELKTIVSTARRFRKVLNEDHNRRKRSSCMQQVKVRSDAMRAREDAEKRRQRNRYNQFREHRKVKPVVPDEDKEEMMGKFLALYEEVRPPSRSTADMLLRALKDSDIPPEEKRLMCKFAPMVREHLIASGALSTEEAAKWCVEVPGYENGMERDGGAGCEGPEDDVYDIYFPVETSGCGEPSMHATSPADWLDFEVVRDHSSEPADDTEDPNAEDWHGNDYPDEEGSEMEGNTADCEGGDSSDDEDPYHF
eukprot:evm.model.scf_562.4 EVM.evm.TU.scf_562.4   scf_562:55912-61117(-)